jgi:hypothetical protein
MIAIANSHPVFSLLFLVGLPTLGAVGQAPDSTWVHPSAAGDLLYQLDDREQHVADFSQCGYRGGSEAIPKSTTHAAII